MLEPLSTAPRLTALRSPLWSILHVTGVCLDGTRKGSHR